MSLRVKLIWAFVAVTFFALVLSGLGLAYGLFATMSHMHGDGMGMMHEGPMQTDAIVSAALQWSLASSLAAFLVAGGAGYWTAHRITRPLHHLRDATQTLDLRDLSRRVAVEGEDEIAQLAVSFNRMAEGLEAEDRSRRHLLADVAHELRHPLAVMQVRLDLMLDGKVELEPAGLLSLQDEVARMTRMVGDLSDLSLAEVGALTLHRSPLDLVSLLEGLVAHLEPVAEGRQVQLAVDLPPSLPPVDADPDRIRQVLFNLVTNALQHSESGSAIAIRAWAADQTVHVAVTDAGPGIPPEHLPYIFDRFYRTDRSRTRGVGGSGLGLAIVRSLMDLHQGRVTVQSKPGEGSTFTISLPFSR